MIFLKPVSISRTTQPLKKMIFWVILMAPKSYMVIIDTALILYRKEVEVVGNEVFAVTYVIICIWRYNCLIFLRFFLVPSISFISMC